MGFVQRRLLRAVLSVTRHPYITLVIVASTLAVCIAIALSTLTISSSQNKLFSSKVDFFHNYLDFIDKFPENEAVYIIVQPKDDHQPISTIRWMAAADAITEKLKSMPQYVRSVSDRVPVDQLGSQALLFEDPSKLAHSFEQDRQIVRLAKTWGESAGVSSLALSATPLQRYLSGVALAPPAERAQAQFLTGEMARSWTMAISEPDHPLAIGDGVTDLKQLGQADPISLGYYYVPDESDPSRQRHRLLVRVYPRQDYRSLTAVTRTVDAIRDAAHSAAAPYSEFFVGVTGRPALEADEMRTSDHDSNRAETVALIVIFIGMALMLRSIRLALMAEIALGVGIGWTFGWATVSKGELNLLSLVFMIALIGIGMDYLVQILMRYRLESRRYERAGAIWVRVFHHVGPPINTACLGAAGAFLVSTLTDFQGAADLGVIAGGGLILCLISGYTVLPALLTIFPAKFKPIPASGRYVARPRLEKASRLFAPLAWICALFVCSPFIGKAHFDANLLSLQVQNMESVQLVKTLQTWSAVILSKDLSTLRQLREAIIKCPSVKSTDSILSAQDNLAWLKTHANEAPAIYWSNPPPVSASDIPGLALQADALAAAWESTPTTQTTLLRPQWKYRDANIDNELPAAATAAVNVDPQTASSELKKFAAALRNANPTFAAARLSLWQIRFIDELKSLSAPLHPKDLDLSAMPIELRSHFMSVDGYYALYITPKKSLWDDNNLKEFVTEVEKARATVANAPPVTGIASDVYHTTGSIRTSFFHATFYALALIFILVWLDFRKLGRTLGAISVLALGLPMLVAIMGRFGQSWNFANFFGLPILIGAGHEYGVFMMHRYIEAKNHPKRVWREWDVADRALLLCAFVTFSSFGFSGIFSEHQGLKSLGMVMSVGTLCIYFATLAVVRPTLKYLLGRPNR